MQGNQSTVDPAEVAKFEAMAAEWWDLEGKFKPLHMLNPCRLNYITQQISMEFDRDLSADLPFKGLRILDIGCGGGLLCEPMARLGATVVGADAAAGNIPVAKLHAEQSGLEIDYRHITAEALAEAEAARGLARGDVERLTEATDQLVRLAARGQHLLERAQESAARCHSAVEAELRRMSEARLTAERARAGVAIEAIGALSTRAEEVIAQARESSRGRRDRKVVRTASRVPAQ